MTVVLHLITRMDMGGSAQNTISTCTALAGRYKIIMAYGPSHESGMTEEERNEVSRLLAAARCAGVTAVMVPGLIRQIHPWYDINAFFFILRLIREHKPQIVHTHSSKAGMLGRWAAWSMRVKHIIHTPHGHVFHGHFGPFKSRFFQMMERITDWVTDITVALTQGEADDYVNLRVTHPEKLRIIHSGVNLKRFASPNGMNEKSRRKIGLPQGVKAVGTVGWLMPIKAPDVLLAAMEEVWAKHSDVHLVFVGKGPPGKAASRTCKSSRDR